MLSTRMIKDILDEAQEYADEMSGCKKVTVGSAICLNDTNKVIIFGANCTLPGDCKEVGCLREELYGENNKSHRLPSDCRAIHSEIDAICKCTNFGFSCKGATILVTRYPCEACARAIVNSGITKVYYGRKQEISDLTKEIFKGGGVKAYWIKGWTYEDTEE